MKNFFRDYAEYLKSANDLTKVWYKKHWKGTVLFIIVYTVVVFGFIFRNEIKGIIVNEIKVNKKIKEMEA